jgi:hypothetical protein
MSAPAGMSAAKNSIHLFRDCLRLTKHIAGKSAKADNIRRIVKGEFKKNNAIKDEATVNALKSNAIRGLANYLMMESADKDAKFKKVASEYTKSQADSMKDQ